MYQNNERMLLIGEEIGQVEHPSEPARILHTANISQQNKKQELDITDRYTLLMCNGNIKKNESSC